MDPTARIGFEERPRIFRAIDPQQPQSGLSIQLTDPPASKAVKADFLRTPCASPKTAAARSSRRWNPKISDSPHASRRSFARASAAGLLTQAHLIARLPGRPVASESRLILLMRRESRVRGHPLTAAGAVPDSHRIPCWDVSVTANACNTIIALF